MSTVSTIPQLCWIRVDGRKVNISIHAARRWAERVRHDPPRTLREIRPDIESLAPVMEWWDSAPGWVGEPGRLGDEVPPEPPEGYVVLADVVLPVHEGIAVTTMTRGSLAPTVRAFRNRARRDIRAAKRITSADKSDGKSPDRGDKVRLANRRLNAKRKAAKAPGQAAG